MIVRNRLSRKWFPVCACVCVGIWAQGCSKHCWPGVRLAWWIWGNDGKGRAALQKGTPARHFKLRKHLDSSRELVFSMQFVAVYQRWLIVYCVCQMPDLLEGLGKGLTGAISEDVHTAPCRSEKCGKRSHAGGWSRDNINIGEKSADLWEGG